MTISALLALVLGIVLLLFGRRAFWIFVAVAGFIAGLTLPHCICMASQNWSSC